jgi:hypothetical protein
VPCRRPGAKEIGGTALGGEETGVDYESVAEASYSHGKYEEVVGAARSSTIGHCHLE